MTRCAHCEGLILFGGVEANDQTYCNGWCLASAKTLPVPQGYCPACTAATTDTSAGGTFMMNGIGTRLVGAREPCPRCGSIGQRKFLTFVYLPIVPLSAYRVKYVGPKRYLSRKER